MPANAIIATTGFVFLVSLINIGSTVAFNAVLSLASTAMMGTYLISIGTYSLRVSLYKALIASNHRLRNLSKGLSSPFAELSLEPWQSWSSHQHHCSGVFLLVLHLFVLPQFLPCNASQLQLGLRVVCWTDGIRCHHVHLPREARIRRTSGEGSGGRLRIALSMRKQRRDRRVLGDLSE